MLYLVFRTHNHEVDRSQNQRNHRFGELDVTRLFREKLMFSYH